MMTLWIIFPVMSLPTSTLTDVSQLAVVLLVALIGFGIGKVTEQQAARTKLLVLAGSFIVLTAVATAVPKKPKELVFFTVTRYSHLV
ncbi:hypothetical protein [Hymenobacter wooponensis]|uniref:Uncharacterized protein n=1 Tax=Hymenobacter wooponensis TaxID=1525360 RepID=A0A4Z0MK50_9BACT|nr:hypothetical protein [Hymenobacter wooponensis]TGD79565.1 hypothetical protein EU557_15185 [Hymenobacter wooponensis]